MNIHLYNYTVMKSWLYNSLHELLAQQCKHKICPLTYKQSLRSFRPEVFGHSFHLLLWGYSFLIDCKTAQIVKCRYFDWCENFHCHPQPCWEDSCFNQNINSIGLRDCSLSAWLVAIVINYLSHSKQLWL